MLLLDEALQLFKALIIELHKLSGVPFDFDDQIIVADSQIEEAVYNAYVEAPYDVIYIDGGHDYENARSDIDSYRHFLRVGGWLVIDDSSNFLHMPWGSFPGIITVSKAVRDTIEKDEKFEHRLAVMHLRFWERVA